MATAVAAALEALGVYWVEEPLHRGDYAGYAELRRRVAVKIAGGEMTREPYEFRELLERDCLDVFQPDCVCSQGITGLAPLARQVVAAGKLFTPHTWGNGIGVLANMHLTAGTAGVRAHSGSSSRTTHRSGRWIGATIRCAPGRSRGRMGHAQRAPRARNRARRGDAGAHGERRRHVRLSPAGSNRLNVEVFVVRGHDGRVVPKFAVRLTTRRTDTSTLGS